MLFRPLITLVVLTANIGNVSAMVRQKEKPSYNYPNSHPPPAPIAAAMDHSSPIMQPSTYQSSYNPQNQFPQSRVPIPVGDPSFSIAKCGHTRYNKQQIISARTEGCTRMPFYPHYPGTRKAVPYYPANFEDYQEVPPFYLYPIGKPLFNTKNGPYYGFNRIILSQWCEALGVLTELPNFPDLAKKAGKLVMGKKGQGYDKNRYKYKDCVLF